MNKLTDFIYDKNDIVIALLILAVAAGVIFWRMDIILAYPKTLFDGNTSVVEKPIGEDENLPPSGEGENNPVADENENKDNNDSSSAVSPEIPLWDGGVLTEDVEVDVQGASSEAAVGCLVSEGLFADYAEYKQVCEDAGLDHEKVAAGTFTFKSGTTKAQIAKKINWG